MSKENRQGKNAKEAIEILWEESFFRYQKNLSEVLQELSERGNNFSSVDISKALSGAEFLIRRGERRLFKYVQKFSTVTKEVEEVEINLFSEKLITQLGKSFEEEIEDLKWNFGKSGTCTAFLLRKILEKLIYIVFAKNNIENKLMDGSGVLFGLEAMIDISSKEKVGGIPVILPKTAKELRGLKFLGDVAAHNPLVVVKMETIIPQIPFIITAFEELAQRL